MKNGDANPSRISDMNTVVGMPRCGVRPLCPGHRSAMSLPFSVGGRGSSRLPKAIQGY
ncbi:MAG TPA: hypothetical protein VK811_01810 [Candidatus Acidoferrum sp.]|nr:hypothetical protein [Candidatus Acidoferrum sp.]